MSCFVSKDASCTARERPYPFHSSTSVALLSKNQQPLTIEQISEIDKIKAYTKNLQEWNQTAQALAKKASKQKIPECDQYRCAAQITENLANKIFSPDPDHYYLICKDITDQVQGFMILSQYHLSKKLFKNKKFLKIDLLATRPENIPSILTDVAQRISGIGSALVQVGFEMSADGLVVVPDMAARPFYIKNQFCEIPCNFMMQVI